MATAADRLRRDARAVPSDRADRLLRRGRGSRLLGRDGRRPSSAVGAAAGPGRVRLGVHGGRGGAHQGRCRPGRDLPVIPHAPGRHRPGRGDARGHVPGSLLAGPGIGRGAQRARRCAATGPRRPSGSTGCSRRSRSSIASSPARTSSTTGASSRWRRSLWTMPETPPIYVATAGPITAKRTGRLRDGLITVGAPEGKLEMIRERAREGRREAGRIPTRSSSSCSSTCRGPRPTRRRSPTR